MKKFSIIVSLFALFMSSCTFLDIVPDNVATIEYAFRLRSTAERYLATCYSYLPDLGEPTNGNPAMFGADEFWLAIPLYNRNSFLIAQGLQNSSTVRINHWDGLTGGIKLWEGIRECNIFLENIMNVPDMDVFERMQWVAEVKFLKAYYHFYLFRMYGPIPIVRENLPLSASPDEVRVFRAPVDEVVDYIIELIDEAIEDLPDMVISEMGELGRIVKPIAVGFKAKILVYAASPLFNGNKAYEDFAGSDGKILFNQEYQSGKWQKAVDALETAIDYIHSMGYELYEFEETQQTRGISTETTLTLTYRGKITERWNSEIIWANTNSTTAYLQQWCAPRALVSTQMGNTGSNGSYGTHLKMAGLFYTKNGVPIDEDTEWDYTNRFDLREGTEAEKHYIKQNYTTANFNFDREARFYGAFGFDGGIWYGNGNYDDNNPYWIESKTGQYLGKGQAGWHSVGGYWVKKLIYYTNAPPPSVANQYLTTNYPWVMLRLGDLYLLYAEALNELSGPSQKVYDLLYEIRKKAGLPRVEDSWENYSNAPGKYTTQDGLREIIHRERAIEMAFEGQRFWDLRRWKEAIVELNAHITGWDVDQDTNEGYYRQRILFDQQFTLKDYFWPIREATLLNNKNLVQNPGW